MYLMIRNKGVADSRAITLLGVSTSRNSNHAGTVGQFGSGAAHAIGLFLKHGIPVTYFSGNLKMEFYSKPIIVSGDPFNQVMVKYSGKDENGVNRTSNEEVGFCLEWGLDWKSLSMGFREFIANAIDGSIVNGGSYKDIEIEVKDSPRAKAGHTAVFLPMNEEVQKMWQNLGGLFLHYSKPHLLIEKILPKQFNDGYVRFYKKGVLVGSEKGESIFDYNLGDELVLDESRNANPWDTRYAVSKALSAAEPKHIAQILMAQLDGKDIWENKLDADYLYGAYDTEETRAIKAQAFKTAFKAVAGENGIAVSGTKQIAEIVEKKGFKPIRVPTTWFTVLDKYGIPTEKEVLNGLERDGIPEYPPTTDMIKAVDEVWELFKAHNLLNGREKPTVKAFMPIMSAGGQTWAQAPDSCNKSRHSMGVVYFHTDLSAMSPLLLKAALEECTHHVTGSTDCSRDFQDFLFRLIVRMWKNNAENIAA